MIVASKTPGKNGFGISNPNARISHPGMMRNAPSSQPMYQSGCDAADTSAGLNGPNTQIGLICTSPPRKHNTAAVRKKRPSAFDAYDGHMRSPTTLNSSRPGPENCVCLWRTTRNRCALNRIVISAGSSRMWMTYSRWMMSGPGNSPPNSSDVIHVPTTGIDRAIEYAMRSPVPDSWSSSNE